VPDLGAGDAVIDRVLGFSGKESVVVRMPPYFGFVQVFAES
jgi:hypothetical protein